MSRIVKTDVFAFWNITARDIKASKQQNRWCYGLKCYDTSLCQCNRKILTWLK